MLLSTSSVKQLFEGSQKGIIGHLFYGLKNLLLHLRRAKKDLADATVLHHPSADASLAIVVDASDTAVGAALHQQTSKGWKPLVFFSKTLSLAQWRYGEYDRELLAAYMAIK
ncbi:retrovirus-related Pol polyprotein from transposon 297 [Trichonephila clavipes]|uniref:Retrovirus-related Pol polyprotein from transposon 297 n=1 Tax=Trichonephila clavipes TaxID=2585209 RepID=A0A8X6RG06_TRICX|nr:retrovirus-related Pol polyprotein from transposon 297 [Trichonephila clavipes]